MSGTNYHFGYISIDNDGGSGDGGAARALYDAAQRVASRPLNMPLVRLCNLLDDYAHAQQDGGWWPKFLAYPDRGSPEQNAAFLAKQGGNNAHFDDNSMTGLVEVYILTDQMLAGTDPDRHEGRRERYQRVVERWFAFVELVLERCGGIPGQASVNGDAVQQREFEPGGMIDTLSTKRVGQVARLAGEDGIAMACEALLEEVKGKAPGGKTARFVDIHTRAPVYADADGKRVSRPEDAKANYRWVY